MRYLKEKGRRRHTGCLLVIIAVMAVVIAVLILMVSKLKADVRASTKNQIGAVNQTQYAAEPDEDLSADTEQVPVESQVSNANEVIIQPRSGYCLSTPIADLYIPETWEEMVKTEDGSEEDCFAVTVCATGDAPEVKLYTIYMGEEATQGDLIGTAVTEDGKPVQVSILIHEIEISDDWDSGEVDTLFAMQESANEIIQQITELPDFEPAR